MKQLAILITLFAVFLFSGCTFNGQPDGGVYKSVDGGKVFEQKVKIDEKNDIANANVLALEIDPNSPETIYVGTRNDGVLRSTNGGESWVRDVNNFVSVNSILVDPTNSQTIYVAALRDGRGKIFKTTNGGEKWEEIFTENADGPQVLSLVMEKSNPNVLYAGDSLGGIYKTEDGGASWKSLLWMKSAVRKIAIDQVNPSIVYFGTTNSGALVTADGGVNFTEIVSDGYIYALQTHPSRENVVFLSDKNGLQKSEDGGETWTVLNTLVKPDKLGSRGLAIDSNNDQVILYASGRAFYKTTNGGESWTPVQFNITRSIEVIKINPTNPEVIYLGANNRDTGVSLLPQ